MCFFKQKTAYEIVDCELEFRRVLFRSLQIKRKRQLEALGFLVYCIDGIEQIGGVLDEIEQR